MARALGVVVLVVMGCTQSVGPQGERGPAGPQGAPGATGAAGARGADGANAALSLVWVDHRGTLVGSSPSLIDDAGQIWPLDIESGDLAEGVGQTYWTDAGCAGVAVISPQPPRELVRHVSGWRLRPEALPSQVFNVTSYALPDGGCQALVSTLSLRGLRLGDTDRVNEPTTPYVGPLHRELR